MHLAAHVHAAVIGPDVVLLDLEADSYACLPGARDELGLSEDLRRLAPTAEAAAALRGAGYVSDQSVAATWRPPPVGADLMARGVRPLSAGDIASLGGCGLDLARFYRGRTLPQILQAVAARAPAGRTAEPDAGVDDQLAELVAKFQSGAIWLPAPGKCLARSFLLLRFLHRAGRTAAWVFGVRTWPFAAHCWLQAGDVALDEAAELAAEYTPIFAVR